MKLNAKVQEVIRNGGMEAEFVWNAVAANKLFGPPEIGDTHKVGIEIELERANISGSSLAVHTTMLSNQKLTGWRATEDRSLRNHGVEFITPYGVNAAQASQLLNYFPKFWESIGKTKPEANFRTGLHIHLNCKDLSLEQLWNLLAIYAMFEDTLFFISGERKRNIHCVPWREAYEESFYEFIGNPEELPIEAFIGRCRNANKYSSLNYKALWQHGTVEFRHHKGTADPREIIQWLTVLSDIYNYATTTPRKTILESLETLNVVSNYEDLIRNVFPRTRNIVKSFPGIHRDIREGVVWIKEKQIEHRNLKESHDWINMPGRDLGIDVDIVGNNPPPLLPPLGAPPDRDNRYFVWAGTHTSEDVANMDEAHSRRMIRVSSFPHWRVSPDAWHRIHIVSWNEAHAEAHQADILRHNRVVEARGLAQLIGEPPQNDPQRLGVNALVPPAPRNRNRVH